MDNGKAVEVMETLRGCQTFFCSGFCAYRNQYGDECQHQLHGDALALIEQLIRQSDSKSTENNHGEDLGRRTAAGD